MERFPRRKRRAAGVLIFSGATALASAIGISNIGAEEAAATDDDCYVDRDDVNDECDTPEISQTTTTQPGEQSTTSVPEQSTSSSTVVTEVTGSTTVGRPGGTPSTTEVTVPDSPPSTFEEAVAPPGIIPFTGTGEMVRVLGGTGAAALVIGGYVLHRIRHGQSS